MPLSGFESGFWRPPTFDANGHPPKVLDLADANPSGAYVTLDLSGDIPAGSEAVLLSVEIGGNTMLSNRISFRKSADFVAVETVHADGGLTYPRKAPLAIEVLSDRSIQYQTYGSEEQILIVVRLIGFR